MQQTFFLLKPTFVEEKTLESLLTELEKEELKIKTIELTKYSSDSASVHYNDHKEKKFFKELVDYLSSGLSLGIIATGENAIQKGLDIKEKLRTVLSEKYNFETDVMKNIIHSSDSLENAKKEIDIFLNLNDNLKL